MDKIGPYEILETVHRGPQPLYRARGKDGKEVALKAVAVASLSEEARERFKREAETCRALDHPNIVKMFDAGEADGCLYQAMEMLQGADLRKVMTEGRHLTWENKLSIMEQVAEGLEYAHARKLVHRDIKPANLFLENSGRVKVLDFGMVRVAESQLTKIGSSLGTLNYMGPEQIRGERCTAATDVFSAGIVFYELATGRHPFSSRDRSLGQVVSAIVFEAPPKLSELCPDAPEGLEFILNRALEKDPARRIHHAGDLKQALDLCRMTFVMDPVATPPYEPAPRPPASASDLEKTRALPSLSPSDPEKTRVIHRPPGSAPVPPPAPVAPLRAAPLDDEKTHVMQRQSIAVPPPPPPPAPAPQPPKPSPRVPVQQQPAVQRIRFCPSCTSPNRPEAVVCQRCQTPLVSGTVPVAAPKQTQWPLYLAIAVAALLAVALIVVLVVKQS